MSATERVSLQPAWVLHSRPFRETSALVEALSRDHGRIGLVARGARASRSRWKGLLQPFRPLLISWSQRGELATLTGAEQVAAPPPLVGEALYCGLYLNELLVRLLHRGDPHPEVFDAYRATLAELSSGVAPQPALRLFERDLLSACGFGLQLGQDAGGRDIVPDAAYAWRAERGFERIGPDHDSAEAVPGQALLDLRAGSLEDDAQLAPLRRLMRRVIRYHLGGRPLAAQDLFR